jgi:uncharacterized protein YegL
MQGAKINQLNQGLMSFKNDLSGDSMAMKRVELAAITFGPVATLFDFHTPDLFQPPQLSAHADTPMGAAIVEGLEMLKQRKATYKANGISYFRPWVFLITDGEPTDSWNYAAQLIKEGESASAFSFFAVGVQGANMDILNQMAPRGAIKLDGLKFRELFSWLSASLKNVSRSRVGETVALPPPSGWASV